jgi:uncharacterized protein (UPF0335 family)
MNLFNNTVIHITDPQGTAALSKEQKTFNRLIKQIDEQRKLLEAWNNILPVYAAKVGSEYRPVVDGVQANKASFAKLLDQAYGSKGLTKTENKKLSQLILDLASQVLEKGENSELEAIYQRHNDVSYTEEQQEVTESMKLMMEKALGLDLSEENAPQTPEEMMQLLHKKLQNEADEAEAARKLRQSKRKLSAKALAKQAKDEEEAKNVSQSIRDVYRKLASTLHPDREPDEAERARKTTLMQQVNTAYDKKDLLKLLELQLKIEQIDPNLTQVADSRLKHYNKILAEQLVELQSEVAHVEMPFNHGSFYAGPRITPGNVIRSLNKDIAELKRDLQDMQADLCNLGDIKALKVWLKNYRLQSAERSEFGFLF